MWSWLWSTFFSVMLKLTVPHRVTSIQSRILTKTTTRTKTYVRLSAYVIRSHIPMPASQVMLSKTSFLAMCLNVDFFVRLALKLIIIIIFEKNFVIHAIFRKIWIDFTAKSDDFLSIHSVLFFSTNNWWIYKFLLGMSSWDNLSCFVWFRFWILDSLQYIIDLTWNEHSFDTEKLILRDNVAIVFNNVDKFKFCLIQNMSNCFQIATKKSKHQHNHYSMRKTMENGLTKTLIYWWLIYMVGSHFRKWNLQILDKNDIWCCLNP